MSRLDLDRKLKAITTAHSMKLYFQPPDGLQLSYPCVVYEGLPGTTIRADNRQYVMFRNYNITFITKKEDLLIPKQILEAVKYGSITREFKSDNLYHTVISCSEIY